MAVRKFLMPALDAVRPELEAALRERMEELVAGQPAGTVTASGRFDRGGVDLYLVGDAGPLVEALERVNEAARRAVNEAARELLGFVPDSSRWPATPDDGDLDEPDTADD